MQTATAIIEEKTERMHFGPKDMPDTIIVLSVTDATPAENSYLRVSL